MSAKNYRLWTILVLIAGVLLWSVLQLGFLNWGQHFGAYGQYNRVLSVIRSMDGYAIVDSRLSRRLDWRNVGHIDRFSVRIRDPKGVAGRIEFIDGSPELQQRDSEALKQLIKTRLEAQQGTRPSK